MFQIYLKESNKSLTPNYTQLDTEDVDVSTVFSISDISDISSRKDTITKNITFKGTPKNNQAFGYHFFLNKHVDRKLNSDGSDDVTDEKMFFNYIPSRKVDCMIFEDSILILNGSLLLQDANVDKDKNITYDTIVTGKIMILVSVCGDKLLTDLDLSDLKHQYNQEWITGSWGASDLDDSFIDYTQRYNPSNDSYFPQAFEKGSGYVYPFIDYGEKFLDDSYNKDYTHISLHNYRPAIWVKEYINRIFKDAGFTYEIKGDNDFIDRFNSLIIPNNEETLTSPVTSGQSIYKRDSTSTSITQDDNKIVETDTGSFIIHPIQLPTKTGDATFTDYGPDFGDNLKANTKIQFKNGTKVSINVSLTFDAIANSNSSFDATVEVQLMKTSYSTDVNDITGWTVIGSFDIPMTRETSKTDVVASFSVLDTAFDVGDQLCLWVKDDAIIAPGVVLGACTYTITNAEVLLPINDTDTITINAQYGDYILPSAPSGIKQFDFVKSILTLLNLYVYNEKENPTHLYLQPYDDFYSQCKAPYILSTALDWTSKIDYTNGLKINSNLDLPNKYNFTFTEDGDYLNTIYKNKYSEVYGSYTAEDKLGLTDEKDVEVIFSPTPMIIIPGQNMLYGFMADGGTSLSDKKVKQSNIRILYYNGPAYSTNVAYSEDVINGTALTVLEQFTSNIYAQASNYYIQIVNDTNNLISAYTFKHDIHFSKPKEHYFFSSDDYSTLPTSYSNYENQIQELIDQNLFTIECSALLNEIDISNLDFHLPIFIDTGLYGHSYFKIQTVEYSGNTTSSKITLQKIVL